MVFNININRRKKLLIKFFSIFLIITFVLTIALIDAQNEIDRIKKLAIDTNTDIITIDGFFTANMMHNMFCIGLVLFVCIMGAVLIYILMVNQVLEINDQGIKLHSYKMKTINMSIKWESVSSLEIGNRKGFKGVFGLDYLRINTFMNNQKFTTPNTFSIKKFNNEKVILDEILKYIEPESYHDYTKDRHITISDISIIKNIYLSMRDYYKHRSIFLVFSGIGVVFISLFLLLGETEILMIYLCALATNHYSETVYSAMNILSYRIHKGREFTFEDLWEIGKAKSVLNIGYGKKNFILLILIFYISHINSRLYFSFSQLIVLVFLAITIFIIYSYMYLNPMIKLVVGKDEGIINTKNYILRYEYFKFFPFILVDFGVVSFAMHYIINISDFSINYGARVVMFTLLGFMFITRPFISLYCTRSIKDLYMPEEEIVND